MLKKKTKKDSKDPSSGAAPVTKPRKAAVSIEDRIPQMTDADLKSLHANAERLAATGSKQQQTEAERLMPAIAAELEVRAAARTEAQQAKKTAQREAKQAARARP